MFLGLPYRRHRAAYSLARSRVRSACRASRSPPPAVWATADAAAPRVKTLSPKIVLPIWDHGLPPFLIKSQFPTSSKLNTALDAVKAVDGNRLTADFAEIHAGRIRARIPELRPVL